jgi:hypothetical protein
MRMQTGTCAALALMIAASTPALSAHHNASHTYDAEHPVALSGTVTDVQWKNPHVLVHLDAKQADGTVVDWRVELVAALFMNREGIVRDVLKPGDPISMTVCVAKDGSHTAAARSVTIPSAFADKRVGFCYVPSHP